MFNKTGWVITMTWTRAKLSENAFVAAKTAMRAAGFVANVGVEELNESWKEDMLSFEDTAQAFGREKVS